MTPDGVNRMYRNRVITSCRKCDWRREFKDEQSPFVTHLYCSYGTDGSDRGDWNLITPQSLIPGWCELEVNYIR